MIIDTLENGGKYTSLHPLFGKAFEFLNSIDLKNVEAGKFEISDGLKGFENIQFSYFETAVKEKELIFHYQLKEGVSQDRLGYLILEREGVVDLLKNISKNKY
jgi:hypothetical protein